MWQVDGQAASNDHNMSRDRRPQPWWVNPLLSSLGIFIGLAFVPPGRGIGPSAAGAVLVLVVALPVNYFWGRRRKVQAEAEAARLARTGPGTGRRSPTAGL